MKKVLVTGATGFIGKETLSFLLARGFEVHCVARHIKEQTAIMKQCTWHIGNLLDFMQLRQLMGEISPNYLLHFAWNVSPGIYLNANDNFTWLQASLELIRAFHEYGGERIVCAGTCFEYDLKYGYCSEDFTPLLPNSIYGLCKHSLENLLSGYSKNNNLSFAWGRIFYLYGPGEYPTRLIPAVICSLLQERYAKCSHGRQIRDYLYIRDAAEAFATLLDSEYTGKINICSGVPVKLNKIITMIGEILGRIELIKLGALSVPSDEPPLILGNPQRLQTALHWFPKHNLDSGLRNTIAWWQESLDKSC